MSTIPYRAPQRPQRRATRSYNPADVVAYADQHGTAQAAQRFGIDERSVRRIRQKAEPKQELGTTVLTAEDYRGLEALPKVGKVAAEFPDTADDRAGDSTYWKCPATGELMPVVPGTHRKDWERERHAAHTRHLESLVDPNSYVKDRTPDTATDTPQPDMSASPDMRDTESGSQETSGHVHDNAAPVGPVLSAGPVIVRERVVTRIVIRERETVGLVAWIREHPGAAHQAVAWLIAALLIGVASLG